MKKICLAGYSGHAYVVAEIASVLQYTLVGYFDLEEKKINPFKLKYLGNENEIDLSEFSENNIHVALGLGDNKTRKQLFEHFKKNKISIEILQHPNASVSALASINEGTVIMPAAVINPLAKIGKAVICNTACIIEHECIIEDFVHIAPGAVLAGNVEVKENTFIGANAFIKQGVKIGRNVIIGAGSVVLKNIDDNVVVYGNPARIKNT
jgi:sugar O-acyltransferase (sialic acid O-acetyltransferase NeuD family)